MVYESFSLVDFELFLLVLVRIATFVFVAPFFSMDGAPNITKIGFSGIVSILVLFAIEPQEVAYQTAFGYGVLVFKEAMTGLIIGYASNVCSAIILFAGNLIDMDIGLSMATEFDPAMNTQVTITGNIYNYFMLIFLVASDMYRYILQAIIDSFTLIPLGGAVFRSDRLLKGFSMYFADLFVIGFRIMLPIFAVIMILNCVLGIMAKVAQQMNMFSVGMQIKVLTGLAVLFLVVFLFPEVCAMVFNEMRRMMRIMVQGLY